MTQPKGIDSWAWQEAIRILESKPEDTILITALSLMDAYSRGRADEEQFLSTALKDPITVRVNYLRGGIACQPLIDYAVEQERERCAKRIESYYDHVPDALRGAEDPLMVRTLEYLASVIRTPNEAEEK